MNFLISFTDETNYVLTGATFPQAITFANSIPKELSFISQLNSDVEVLEQNTSTCFNILGKNTSTNQTTSKLVFSSDINAVYIWLETQPVEVIQIGKSQKILGSI